MARAKRRAAAPLTVGTRIRAARLAAGLTQEELGGTELTKGFISQVELDRVRPSLRSLQIIATRLGRDVHEFLDEDDPQLTTKRASVHHLAAHLPVETRSARRRTYQCSTARAMRRA